MWEIVQSMLAGVIFAMPAVAFLHALGVNDASRIICRRSLTYWGAYIPTLVYLEVYFIAVMQALLLIHCAEWKTAAAPFVSLGALFVNLIVGGVVYGNMLKDSRDARIGFLRGLLVWLVSAVWWWVVGILLTPVMLIILLSVKAGVGAGPFWLIAVAALIVHLVGIYFLYRATVDKWLRRRVRHASNSSAAPRTSAAKDQPEQRAPLTGTDE